MDKVNRNLHIYFLRLQFLRPRTEKMDIAGASPHAPQQLQGLPMSYPGATAYKVDDVATQCNFVLTKNKVLLIGLMGVVSRASMESVMVLIRRTASGRADAFCLHMDKALMTIGQSCADEINPADAQGISGAIVVRVDGLELARRHAGRMAHYGIVREVFTSRADALAWAEHQAQLCRDQRAWVLARRSA